MEHYAKHPAIIGYQVYNEVKAGGVNNLDTQDDLFIAYSGDHIRTVAKGNYIVTETNVQAIGWNSREQFPPYDSQLQ
ncbi:hypothetical protein EZS27_014702 [termite gut metagenome]|uniref:Beta-galactosidase n=1 Tax=termite gut metagenome TaxID=433724 RepID=A0A5J4RVK2_9ZZZZ